VKASFSVFYIAFYGNSGTVYAKIRVLFTGTLSSTLELNVVMAWKCCHGMSVVAACCQLTSTKMDAFSVINRTIVSQLS